MVRETVRRGVSLLFSLLLTLSVSLIALLTVFLVIGGDANAVVAGITEEYAQSAYNDLAEDWYALGQPSRIPEDVFDSVLTREEFQEDLRAYAQTIWNGGTYVVKTEKMGARLTEAFTTYVQAQGVEVTEEIALSLDNLTIYCIDRYRVYVTVPMLPTVAGMMTSLKGLCLWGLGGALVLGAALAWLLCRIQSKRNWWRYLAYAAFGGMLVVLPVPLYLLWMRPQDRISLRPDYVKGLYTMLLDRVLWDVVIAGIVLLLAGLLLILAGRMTGRYRGRTPGLLLVPDCVVADAKDTESSATVGQETEKSQEINPGV